MVLRFVCTVRLVLIECGVNFDVQGMTDSKHSKTQGLEMDVWRGWCGWPK